MEKLREQVLFHGWAEPREEIIDCDLFVLFAGVSGPGAVSVLASQLPEVRRY